MCPPETLLSGAVVIFGLIAGAMVMAVMGSPPQRAALNRTIASGSHQELHDATGAERTMGKVTMVKTSDGEHPRDVQHDG
jgi:preprotein translocase subunit SecG